MNVPKGFTLLEVVIVVAILGLLAGVAVPMAGVMLRQAHTDATVGRLDQVGGAVLAYFEDTQALPADLDALAVDPGVAGWAGPYLAPGFVADAHGLAHVDLDGWGRPFRVTATGSSQLEVRSFGEDGAAGGGDDLLRTVNVVPLRRALTLQRMAILDAAILAYNRNRAETTPPLPGDVAAAFNLLIGAGYLPNDPTLLADGFGQAFTADPPGQSPLVKVASPSLGN